MPLSDDKLKMEITKSEEGVYVGGSYITSDGGEHQYVSGALSEILDLGCGCGRPSDAILYVYGALKLLQSHFEGKGETWWQEWRNHVNKYFHNDTGAEYFTWYRLCEMDLEEHGGSVPGWLTERGKQAIALIETHMEALTSE